MNPRKVPAAVPKTRRASVTEGDFQAWPEDERAAETTPRAQTAAIVGQDDARGVTAAAAQIKTKRGFGSIFPKKAQAPSGPRPLESLDLTSLKVQNARYLKSIKVPPLVDHESPVTIAVRIDGKNYVVKARTVDLPDHILNTNLIRALGLSGVTSPGTSELPPLASRTLHAVLTSSSIPGPDLAVLERALDRPSQISEMASGSTINQIEGNPLNLAAFKEWANSAKGVSALSSMAFVDLLVGMNDRVIEKWNGANFTFDSKNGTLNCIDNAKDSALGLLNDNNDVDWVHFVHKNLNDRLVSEQQFDTIPQAIARFLYKEGSQSPLGSPSLFGQPPAPVDPGKVAQIEQVVHNAFWEVSGKLPNIDLPPEVAARLQARLKILGPLLGPMGRK